VRGEEIRADRPVILGILNLTPDSFSDGGAYGDSGAAIARAQQMIDGGADLIDVGGESSRPGVPPVDGVEEWRRIGRVVEALAVQGMLVSVDTTKAEVAERAVEAGAAVLNDISGLATHPGMADVAAESGAGLILMHMRGSPRTMQHDVSYGDLVAEVGTFLSGALDEAERRGCRREQLVIDPGIGFGKSACGNLELLARLGLLDFLGRPIMVGPSRKSFIGALLDVPVDERLEGTLAACVAALERGARLFRVHDVTPVRRALDLAWAIQRAGD
jgi:dihydropteroate synthase